MPLFEQNKLAKLTIHAFSDERLNEELNNEELKSVSKFTVMFNPATLSIAYSNQFERGQVAGTGEPKSAYKGRESTVLSLKLIMDGTGIYTSQKNRVASRIKAFFAACHHKHDTASGAGSEPNILRITWHQDTFVGSTGSTEGVLGHGFVCRLQRATVNYTSFDRNGVPLRAEIDAMFVEHLIPGKQGTSPSALPTNAQAAVESAPGQGGGTLSGAEVMLAAGATGDASGRGVSGRGRAMLGRIQSHIIRSGDTLPLLCTRIYGSPRHYIRVARANGLDNFRKLTPGQELIFPPIPRG